LFVLIYKHRNCCNLDITPEVINSSNWTAYYYTLSLSLGVGLPSGAHDQIFFLSDNCGAPPLTRGCACNLLVQLLLCLARAVTLRSKSHRTQDHILLSHLRRPQPGRQGPLIYIPQEQGGLVIPPITGFPLCHLLRLAGLWCRYTNLPPHGSCRSAKGSTIRKSLDSRDWYCKPLWGHSSGRWTWIVRGILQSL
jgi:hypothetical protein